MWHGGFRYLRPRTPPAYGFSCRPHRSTHPGRPPACREGYSIEENKDKYILSHLISQCFPEAHSHGARGRGCRHAVWTRCEWPVSNSGVQRRLRLQKCTPSEILSLCLTLHFCSRLPPLSEGGQSGWRSCRLDLLSTFSSREKLKKILCIRMLLLNSTFSSLY